MIKLDIGKGKSLSFDIDIEGGSDSEIKEGRFIISCKNKKYKLMFEAIIKDGVVNVEIPPLDINTDSGKCFLEMISNDNQYYSVWESPVKFERNLKIKVKEQKEVDKKPVVSLNENKTKETKKDKIKENKIIKSSETVMLYRTIKCDEKTINKVLSENEFLMKPKSGVRIKFYESDSMLLNDLENINFGLCIGMSVPENGIIKENGDHTIIVNSSFLDDINVNNVLYIIKEGQIIQLKK